MTDNQEVRIQTSIKKSVAGYTLEKTIAKESLTTIMRFKNGAGERLAVWIMKPKKSKGCYKKKWKHNINNAMQLTSLLSHPNILQVYNHCFTEDCTCEILCEDFGAPLTSLTEGPPGLYTSLATQSLAALADLERRRILLVGDIKKGIMVDRLNIKVVLHSFKKVLPRWSEMAMRSVSKSGDETLLKTECKYSSGRLQEEDEARMSVCSWANMMHKLAVGLEAFSVTTIGLARGLTKAVLNSSPMKYPSFTALNRLAGMENCSEEKIIELTNTSCSICGSQIAEGVCSYCNDEYKVLSSIEENPYAAIKLISGLPKDQVLSSIDIWNAKFQRVSQEAHLEFLYCVINYTITIQDVQEAFKLIKLLLRTQRHLKGINTNSMIIENIKLFERILPYKGPTLPDFFTVRLVNSCTLICKESEYREIPEHNVKLSNNSFASNYVKILVIEQSARCFATINQANIEQHFEALKMKLGEYKDSSFNKKIKKIRATEKLLQILFEFGCVHLIPETLDILSPSINLCYSEADCKEYVEMFQLAALISQSNIKKAQEKLEALSSNREEESDRANSFLLNYYRAVITKCGRNEEGAFKILKKCMGHPFVKANSEQLLNLCLKLCEYCAETRRFNELKKYAEEAKGIEKNPETLFYCAIAMEANNNSREAHEILNNIITRISRNAYTNHLVRTMVLLEFANELFKFDSFKKARVHYEMAYESCKKLKLTIPENAKLLSKIWVGITNTYRVTMPHNEIAQKYEEALREVRKEEGDLVLLLLNATTFELREGNRVKASEYFKEAKDLVQGGGDAELEKYIGSIQECLSRKTRVERVKEDYKEKLGELLDEIEGNGLGDCIDLLLEEIKKMLSSNKREFPVLEATEPVRELLNFLKFKEQGDYFVIERCCLPYLAQALIDIRGYTG